MKDFSEFEKTLTQDKVKEIVGCVNAAKLEIPVSPNSAAAASTLTNSFGTMDYIISLELLRAYHEWLSKQ